MDRKGGNKEKMRKCREWITLQFHTFSPFLLHFLFIFSFSLHFLTARLPGCHKLCNPLWWQSSWWWQSWALGPKVDKENVMQKKMMTKGPIDKLIASIIGTPCWGVEEGAREASCGQVAGCSTIWILSGRLMHCIVLPTWQSFYHFLYNLALNEMF